MYDPIFMASRNDDTPRYARKPPTHAVVRASDATTPRQSRRNPMTSVSHLVVPSLTGCVLVASLVFGYPDGSDALARPVADGPRSATAGPQPLLPPGCKSVWRPGTAGDGRGDRPPAGNAMIGINRPRRIGQRPSARRRSSRTWPMGTWSGPDHRSGAPQHAIGSSISPTRPRGGSLWYARGQRG